MNESQNEKINLKDKEGITLIALVISIIVLLILAGVSIMTLAGDNGLLNRTTSAKEKTEQAGVMENIRLAFQSAQIGEYAGEYSGDAKFVDEFQKDLRKVYNSNQTTVTKETDGTYTVDIPGEGKFTVSANGSVAKKSGVIIDTKPTKIKKGETIDLTATLDGVTGNITWETSDSDVISVTSSGRIEGKADSGRAKITAKIDDTEHKDEFIINIAQKITAISVEDITVSKTTPVQLVVNTTPEGVVEDMTYTFSSNKTNIATVNENTGLVTGVATGEATIEVTGVATETLTTTFKVTVPKETVTSVKIKDKNGVEQTVTKSDVESYYGKKVNYTAEKGTYRVFYIDYDGDFGEQGTIYLKADYDKNNKLTCTLYDTTTSPETLVNEMNPERAANSSTWRDNWKAAAWLCMPTRSATEGEWKDYYDTTKADYINYVIGGPSIEMYVKSYNQVSHTSMEEAYVLGAEYATWDYNGYKLLLDGKASTISNSVHWTGKNTIDKVGYGEMYAGTDIPFDEYSKGCWWIASPSNSHSNHVITLHAEDGYIGSMQYDASLGTVCPLVSLKYGFVPQLSE